MTGSPRLQSAAFSLQEASRASLNPRRLSFLRLFPKASVIQGACGKGPAGRVLSLVLIPVTEWTPRSPGQVAVSGPLDTSSEGEVTGPDKQEVLSNSHRKGPSGV